MLEQDIASWMRCARPATARGYDVNNNPLGRCDIDQYLPQFPLLPWSYHGRLPSLAQLSLAACS